MPTVQRKTVRQLINEGAILAVQDGNHGELHPTQEDYVPEGIPFVMASDLKGNDLDLITCKFLPEGLASTLRKGFSLPGDVLLTHKGTLGLTAVVPTLDTPYIMLTPQVTYYRVNSDALRPEYLHYVFSSPEFQKRLLCHVREGTRPYVGITAQLDLEIEYPSIDVQSAVVEELIALDRLIQISQQSIKHLEEAARLIYTEWFVRLRPPRSSTAISTNWHPATLEEAVSINPKTPCETGKEAPFVPMTALSQTGMVIEGIEQRAIGSGAKFQNGDTLLARITPCLENGKTGFVQFLDDENPVASGSTEFIVLRSRRVNPYWIYCLSRTEHFREFAIRSMSGADGRQRVSTDSLAQYPVTIPPAEILEDFEKAVGPMFEQIHTLTKQIAQLRQARDLLLPRLISGQLRL